MKLIILFLFFTTLLFGQERIYTITKNNGVELKAKKYLTGTNFLKVTTLNDDIVEVPYYELNEIQYDVKDKKKTTTVTKHFVRTSDKYGKIMELIESGKCNAYVGIGSLGSTVSVDYYVLREGEQIATMIGSKNVVTFYNFKKTALEYFKDCPVIIERINKNFKRKKIKELVELYNKSCL
jgi:hypothetical protein